MGPGCGTPRDAPREKILMWDQRDLGRPVPPAKIFLFTSNPNHFYIVAIPHPQGAYRDRHGRWARDAMDAACQETNDIARGRRSRVVLTPRRWRQVLEKQASWERRWQESPVTEESAE
jgi:hypothetical protein